MGDDELSGKHPGPEREFHCGVEAALDALGSKWSTVMLAHLKESARRYSELRQLMPDISDKMLTQRLRELADRGLIVREEGEESPPHVTYRLSEEGQTLRPVLQALYDWGMRRAEQGAVSIVAPGGAHP